MRLTPEIVFELLQSEDRFAVNFDEAWQWIGWTKEAGEKHLLKNFVERVDFEWRVEKNSTNEFSRKQLFLTVDCFKAWSMNTINGRKIRQDILLQEIQLQEKEKFTRQKFIQSIVQENPSTWQKRYDNDFFEEAYRITGWKRTTKGHPSCMGHFINGTIYEHFPVGVLDHLRKVNPSVQGGYRLHKHHQHLSSEIGLSILAEQQTVAITVMRLSPSANPKKFKQNMEKACGAEVQIELPFLDDFEQAS